MSDPELPPVQQEPPGTAGIWRAGGLSLLAALVVLVVFVLPAEHDIDPTGLGQKLGIKGMSGYAVSAAADQPRTFVRDAMEFPLAPFESVEYKYALREGQAMLYSWESDGEVVFDFHSEEEGSDPEAAVSFAAGRGASQHGSYVAPFTGIHGWFWENRGQADVVVRLRASGFFSSAVTMTASGEYQKAL